MSRSQIRNLSKNTFVRSSNLVIKLALFVSFAIAIFTPPEAVAGKGMSARAPLFLATAVLIPVVYRMKGIHLLHSKNYPHLADALLAAPFLLDTLGNLFGLYNNFDRTDDVLHFINWFLLIPGIMALIYAKRSSAKDFRLIGAGISAIAIIGWEAFEWLISDAGPFAGKTPDTLTLSYGDTVGDLVISFMGGVAGVIVAKWFFFTSS